jgi:hypothetical protein
MTIDPEDVLTEHDIKILGDLSRDIFDIWSEEIQKNKRERVYDNAILDDFMSEFTIMIDNLIRNKNIKDYISYTHGAYFALEVPAKKNHIAKKIVMQRG